VNRHRSHSAEIGGLTTCSRSAYYASADRNVAANVHDESQWMKRHMHLSQLWGKVRETSITNVNTWLVSYLGFRASQLNKAISQENLFTEGHEQHAALCYSSCKT